MTHAQLIKMHEKALSVGRLQPDFDGMCRYFYIANRILRAAVNKSINELIK